MVMQFEGNYYHLKQKQGSLLLYTSLAYNIVML